MQSEAVEDWGHTSEDLRESKLQAAAGNFSNIHVCNQLQKQLKDSSIGICLNDIVRHSQRGCSVPHLNSECLVILCNPTKCFNKIQIIYLYCIVLPLLACLICM